MNEDIISKEELAQEVSRIAKLMEERFTAQHLYSDFHTRVYAVATYKWTPEPFPKQHKGFRGDWTMYIGAAPVEDGMDACIQHVMRRGNKQPESVARAFFGGLAELMDERGSTYRL